MGYEYDLPDFETVDTDKDEAAERAERRNSFGEKLFYDLAPRKDGSAHIIRIMPPGNGKELWIPNGRIHMPVYRHTNIPGTSVAGRDGERRKGSAVCVKHTYPERDERCDLCDMVRFMYKQSKELGLTPKQLKRFQAGYYMGRKAYVNAISRVSKETQTVEMGRSKVKIPKVWIVGLPTTVREWVDKKMAAKYGDGHPKEGKRMFGNITHPERGFDLEIDSTGEKMERKYSMSLVTPRSPLHEEELVLEAIMQAGHNIGERYKFPSQRHINEARGLADAFEVHINKMEKVVFDNRGSRDDDDDRPRRRRDDDDDRPRRRRDDDDDRPSSRRRDDDDDRPARRRRDDDEDRPSRRTRDEDDDRPAKRRRDEDEDDDRPAKRRRDEDEDARPRRRRDDDDDRPAARRRDDDDRPSRRDRDEDRPARRRRDDEDPEGD